MVLRPLGSWGCPWAWWFGDCVGGSRVPWWPGGRPWLCFPWGWATTWVFGDHLTCMCIQILKLLSRLTKRYDISRQNMLSRVLLHIFSHHVMHATPSLSHVGPHSHYYQDPTFLVSLVSYSLYFLYGLKLAHHLKLLSQINNSRRLSSLPFVLSCPVCHYFPFFHTVVWHGPPLQLTSGVK